MMVATRFLLCALFLTIPVAVNAEQKQCGAESCGAPTKTTRTINGVTHNCSTTKCTKSCCTLADPPVCTSESTSTSDCTPAKVVVPGGKLEKFKAPSATIKQQ
jgi:hypothetical protein